MCRKFDCSDIKIVDETNITTVERPSRIIATKCIWTYGKTVKATGNMIVPMFVLL